MYKLGENMGKGATDYD